MLKTLWTYLIGGKWILAGAAVVLFVSNAYTFYKATQMCENKQIVEAAKDNAAATKGKEKIDAKTRTMDDVAVDALLVKHGWVRQPDN